MHFFVILMCIWPSLPTIFDWFAQRMHWNCYEVPWTCIEWVPNWVELQTSFSSLDKRPKTTHLSACFYPSSSSITFSPIVFPLTTASNANSQTSATDHFESSPNLYTYFSLILRSIFCLRFSRPDSNCITDAKISWSIFDSSVYIILWFSKVCWL